VKDASSHAKPTDQRRREEDDDDDQLLLLLPLVVVDRGHESRVTNLSGANIIILL